MPTSSKTEKIQKTYHTKATGNALATAESHGKESPLQLYGSCFCPFVQRVWIALEHNGLQYQYLEIDPYKKPKALTDINPRGLVPALRDGDWGSYESTVLMEYLEDAYPEKRLLGTDAKKRAENRLWADHVNRHLVPSFYRFLQTQMHETEKSNAAKKDFDDAVRKLVDNAHPQGPFFAGKELGWVDVMAAPWILRIPRVLKPYRQYDGPDSERYKKWIEAMERNEAVMATVSGDELYLDSYERYAEDRPGTSQVAEATRSGKGLP
ncbi:glutathione S-transferase [Saitoella complicata NRRL Y-17804]|uniref:Glutathione transferase n=1 Tax=Saitoella complicata (strain BCRC 22490 / CBS 7301 / JCM 7358 / NBRC 10748 / NRRL Y-17804) TaxID=698492 RepID=A0A0E9NRM1_SAICN|nr:glutathione S-transferase [Saitoella complicata NRRL Y-17804]ODQ52632.1 glutathione S-transferase [Saitoella complicata NRRL Y-17804]GAO52336.1 hypothetical protein G7K_6415-t1 [Saitoella complicata NRRL Y-17804]